MNQIVSILFILTFWTNISFIWSDNGFFMTRDEGKHIGKPFVEPECVLEFYRSPHASSTVTKINDFLGHHNLIKKYCLERETKLNESCSWQCYYLILDKIREPYANLFDPGADPAGMSLTEIQRIGKSAQHNFKNGKCDVIENPTADEFYEYVVASKPVVIRESNSKKAKYTKSSKWTLQEISKALRDTEVVVSATPTGNFDAPEDPTLWGLTPPSKGGPELIVRPAHVQLTFPDFFNIIKDYESNNSNFYLEYFPVYAAFGQSGESGESYKKVLPKNEKWSNILSLRYYLLWLGGGGGGKAGVVNSRLHYDRMENLMTVIRGSKTFYIFDPSQSSNLHAGEPVLQATLSATRHAPRRAGGPPLFTFHRDRSTISPETNAYHTYSPVNIHSPDLKAHPRFANAKGLVCEVGPGDTLFLPSHWWHEVISNPDEEGKSIATNKFFEPFYNRMMFNTTLNYFQHNRYYSHLHELNSARPCARTDICFTESRSRSILNSSKQKNGNSRVAKKKLGNKRKTSKKSSNNRKKKSSSKGRKSASDNKQKRRSEL